jgi:hypothetical protein
VLPVLGGADLFLFGPAVLVEQRGDLVGCGPDLVVGVTPPQIPSALPSVVRTSWLRHQRQRAARTMSAIAVGRNRIAKGSFTIQRLAGSNCSTAAITIGPNAVCTAGGRRTMTCVLSGSVISAEQVDGQCGGPAEPGEQCEASDLVDGSAGGLAGAVVLPALPWHAPHET